MLESPSSLENVKGNGIEPVQTRFVHDEDDAFEMGGMEKKWQGTAADRHDMAVLGRVQELRVSIESIS